MHRAEGDDKAQSRPEKKRATPHGSAKLRGIADDNFVIIAAWLPFCLFLAAIS
jgi:hypothetical protein